MQPSIPRILAAGLLGTLVMTAIGVYVAPLMGIPPMNPANMLASRMGGVTALGWAGHLMIGMVLAVGYATLALGRIPGPGPVQGAVFALAPWLMAQLLVMPMMGMGLFSSSAALAGGSLLGHIMYGAVLGAVVGSVPTPASAFEAAAPR